MLVKEAQEMLKQKGIEVVGANKTVRIPLRPVPVPPKAR